MRAAEGVRAEVAAARTALEAEKAALAAQKQVSGGMC